MVTKVFRRMAALAAGLALAAGAWANGFADFKLSGVIPADAFLAVHTRGHDGKAFLNEQMGRVFEAIERARFDRDLSRIFRLAAADSGMTEDEIKALWDKILELCGSVDWANLATHEYAMGMRYTQYAPELMLPEFVVVMHPTADSLEKNFNGLSGMLRELSHVAETELLYSTEGEGSQVMNRLTFRNAPFPLGLSVGRQGDKLLLAFGNAMIEQVVALLDGQEGEPLSKTDRFQAAFKHLPAPVDSASFFDVSMMVSQIGGYVGRMTEMMSAMGAPPEDSPEYAEYKKISTLPAKIFAEIDIVDYLAGVGATKDKKSTQEAVVVFKEGASDKALYRIFYNNKSVSDPLKYVPADAGNVSVNAGVKPLEALDVVLGFVRKNVPEGEQVDGLMAMAQMETGFDIRQDVLSWIDGQVVSYQIPGPNAFSPGEWLTMISVNDVQKGQQFLSRIVAMVSPQLGQQGSIEPTEIRGKGGFHTIRSPMLAMMQLSAPTIGVSDGWMFIASSPQIITKSLGVASGDSPNFSTNERFKTEGLPLDGAVLSYTFTDLTTWGEQAGQAFAMVGMASMFLGEAGKQPIVQSALGAVTKLGRVFRAFDFLQSSSSISTLDGRVLRTKSITNYREPPKVEKPVAEG